MDINDLALEMSEELMSEELSKAIPPKLYYRLRAWLRRVHSARSAPEAKEAVTQAVTEKVEELIALKTLKKNEFMATQYDSGQVRLDFGSDVPDEVKKAAMSWARKKGLHPIEATLNKSAGATNSMIYSASGLSGSGRVMKRLKWELPN